MENCTNKQRDSKPQTQRRGESKARPASPGAALLKPFKAEELVDAGRNRLLKGQLKSRPTPRAAAASAGAATERKASAKAAAAEVAVACGVCVVVVVVCVS